MRIAIAILAMFLTIDLAVASEDSGHVDHGDHGDHMMKPMEMATSDTCDVKVHFSKDAEGKPGGADYSGLPVVHHGTQDMDMPEMKGAHMDHNARHGGQFIMAPNKMNHLEGTYSERCGFRLFFYNAFTEPVRVHPFRAFVRVVPAAEDEAESHRFLQPSEDGSVLEADLGSDFTHPFVIEAYVKFPGADAPELFTFRFGD